jgi:UDP-N-acetylglucosamine diphosphorylase / glucose-1-phosphate thymidylyltransferase / UDP-N-acetylgalactosamine diphosphorylase / glucosamine-1-phosphate N-acetyltransferase / galactosamine-1-phosphate N-acetyltransferase
VVITQALLPAAGRGIRADSKTRYIPKVLLEVDGRPLIQRNIELIRDEIGIRDFTIVVGYRADQIRDALGTGERLGVTIRYVETPDVARGLAHGMQLAREYFSGPFLTLLADELYLGSNHRVIRNIPAGDWDAMCGVSHTSDLEQIKRNYSVRIADGRITELIEKPALPHNDVLGCGTYLFTPTIFEAIDQTPPSPRSGRVELTDAINTLAKGGRVHPFWLEGTYFNINSVDEYSYAQYITRAARFPDCRVSLVIPAYNEEASIGYVVRDFKDKVHEILVVDNSSRDGTAEVARRHGARVETVRLGGYGDTICWGLDHAVGDVLVVVEADYSFRARDLGKMLEYLKDADMVVGTRTTRELIEQGTNMRGPVRWGNVIVAKLVEAMWWGRQPRFTDVGCTYRALWRDTWMRIRGRVRGIGPELSPEMMVAALQERRRIIEVPVSYHRRVGGESKHSASYAHVSRTALRMLRTVIGKRITGK